MKGGIAITAGWRCTQCGG